MVILLNLIYNFKEEFPDKILTYLIIVKICYIIYTIHIFVLDY